MSDADDRYLAEIADDCEELLGPSVEVLSIERHEATVGVQLSVRYRLGEVEMRTVEGGETVVAAHAALRSQLVVDRVRLAFTAMERSATSH